MYLLVGSYPAIHSHRPHEIFTRRTYLFVAMELYVYSRTISMAVVGCHYVNAAHRTRLYYGLQRAHGPY